MSFEGISKSTPEHISEKSEEYQEYKEKMSERAYHLNEAFGEEYLARIDSFRETITSIDSELDTETNTEEITARLKKRKMEYSEMVEQYIDHIKFYLQKKCEEDVVATYLAFFKKFDHDERITDLSTEELRGLNENKAVALFALVRTGRISPELLEKLTRLHVTSHIEKRDAFEERLPDILADFRDSALKSLEDGYLPITPEQLDSHMQETKVYLSDGMMHEEDVGGEYYQEYNAITIKTTSNLEAERNTIFHETVHALSGKTLLKKNQNKRIEKDIEVQRSGLVYELIDRSGNFAGERFRWLNEAVTEEISMHLGNQKEGEYKREREMLKKLYDRGVPRQAVYKAYFENYDPDAKEKVPAWKQLTQEVSKLNPDVGGMPILMNLETQDKLQIEIEEYIKTIESAKKEDD